MANDLLKFPAGIMDKGVDIYGPKLRSDLVLDLETYNVTDGKSQGIGILYGKSPLPGQSDAETPTGDRCNNIRYSEGTATSERGLTRRTRFFRLIPVTLGDPDDLTKQRQYFAALIGKTSTLTGAGSDDFLDVVLLSNYATASGPVYFYERQRTLYSGLQPSTWDPMDTELLKTELLYENDYSDEKVLNYFRYDNTKPYISSTVLVVSNKKIPMQWMFGRMTVPYDPATDGPTAMNLWSGTADYTDPTVTTIFAGLPSQNRKNPATSQRSITVYGLQIGASATSFSHGYGFSFNLNDAPAAIAGGTGYDVTDEHYVFGEMGFATQDFAATDFEISNGLINDSESFTESGYSAILACGDKPLACLLQDWIYQDDLSLPLWVDLTEKILFPHNVKNTSYIENGTLKQCAFRNWPDFVRGTAMVDSTIGGPALAANGILEANTVYEVTFSLYNKRLNFETNVGDPVKVQVGSSGDKSICLSNYALASTNFLLYGNWVVGGYSPLDFPFLDFDLPGSLEDASEFKKHLNYIEYRFYYRVEGTFEWLPAGSFDAAQLWFRPNPELFAIICKGEVAALPGGQPGGFNDYSPLPKQRYRCVVNYKNRAWWVSPTSIFFSLENNIFAYPTRNAITAQTGEFLGALVHNYPGEAEQTSRLIIFASNAIYVARFTGDKTYQAIRVSPVTVAEFPVDGSDLAIDLWTTVSSFSERSAVVAEGILYYWGAQGIHRDNGTDTPQKISKRLEPDIFSLYDPTKTDEIFCSYSSVTKEITWFYQPRTADATYPRHTLVYNIESDEFLFGKTADLVDDIYQVDLKNTDHPDLSAQRTIVNVRKASDSLIQHPYFFDLKNQSGGMAPKTEFVVKTISTPTSGQRRLTLATGYDATNFATIVAGDYIALNQTKAYATSLTDGDSMIAQVAAISTGSGYLDIILPDGGDLDSSATLTYDEYFPIWHKARAGAGLNGIPWQIKTGYWLASGINNSLIWQWIYMLLQYSAWPKPTGVNTFDFSYRTPSGGDFISDTIRFVENSDGAMQLFHALRQGKLNNQGQALKMILSGIHIGEPWVLQYLEAHASVESGNTLKQYQG